MNAEATAVSAETTATPAAKKAATEYVDVKMTDGRVVKFPAAKDGKRVKRMDKTLLIPGVDGYEGPPGVRFDFRNGQTLTFLIPDPLIPHFATHGASQKIGDVGAGYKDNELDDQIEEMKDWTERLSKGDPSEWTKERTGGGFAGTSILMRALAEFKNQSIDTVRAWLKDKSAEQKKAMRADKRLQPIIQRLEAEDVAKAGNVDTDALFGELDAAPQGDGAAATG